jgi:ferredoxin
MVSPKTAVLSADVKHGLEYALFHMKKLSMEAAAKGVNAYLTSGEPQENAQTIKAIDTAVIYVCGHGAPCVSEDTEILTENGWKFFKDLEPGEKVATLNPKNDELEYQTPTRYFAYPYKGKMLHIKGKYVDQLVTPNHRLYLSLMSGGKFKPYRFIEAKEIGGRIHPQNFKVRVSAKWKCQSTTTFLLPKIERPVYPNKSVPAKRIDIDDWLRFFGYWLAEGCTSGPGKHRGYRVTITQNNDEKRKKIKEVCDRIGRQIGCSFFEYDSNKHSKAVVAKNKQLFTYLRQFGRAHEKYIPKELKMLPPEKLKILVESMCFGDGWWKTPNYCIYYTTSKRLADDLQEIMVKIGGCASIHVRRKGNYRPVYNVSLKFNKKEHCVSKWEWINYEGMVYCVEVPNHIILIRRNGKASFTGNCILTAACRQPFIQVPGGPFTINERTITCLEALGTELVRNRHCHFLSCLTGAYLGYELVATYGARSFIGYNYYFFYGVIIPAHVNLERCNGCGACIPRCPCSAISLVDVEGEKKARINPDQCSWCIEERRACPWPEAVPCAAACPQHAIIVERLPKPGEPPSDYKDFYSAIHSDVAGEEAILLNASTVREGLEAMKRRFQEYLDRYTFGDWKDRPIRFWASLILELDLEHLVAYGNLDWIPYSTTVKPTRLEMLARFITAFSTSFGILGLLIPYKVE